MKSIARIMTDSVPHPITGERRKCYYHVYRINWSLYVDTAWKDEDDSLNHSARIVTPARVKSMKLNDLRSRNACIEIVRAIVDMYRNNSTYSGRQALRTNILNDARYLQDPYRCGFVHNQQILQGTIVDITYSIPDETNVFSILPDNSKTAVFKAQGEIHIPIKSWRKLGE